MKRMFVLMLSLISVVMVSCRNDPSPSPTEKTRALILGKWMLEHAIEEEYDASNAVVFREVYTGTPADSMVFKSDNVLYTYSELNYAEPSDYEILSDSTIRIEFETWKIAKLTTTRFELYAEDRMPNSSERYVQRISMKR